MPHPKVNIHSIDSLQAEFDNVINNQTDYHAEMEDFKEYYDTSAFYPAREGTQRNVAVQSNLLKVFADKNIHYTSPFPKMKVIPDETDEMSRESAALREKVVLATHARNMTELHQRNFAFDATVLSGAFAETTFDTKTREVKIRRLDPRYCYWQESDDNDNHLHAFWTAYPVTYQYVRDKYGIEPEEPLTSTHMMSRSALSRADGEDWTLLITRYDDTHIVAWVGGKYAIRPHEHRMGVFPIDFAIPFRNGQHELRGDFYLRQLVPLQAEFNETLRRRANVVRKLGNPAVWGRGVVSRQFDEVKRALSGDGGFVGLKANGELGLLQIPETKMLDNHLLDIMTQMRYISGFGSASFGENEGANTSGDALSMYFTPTTRAIEDQQVVWTEFYRSINSKILCLYRKFLRADETKKLHGVVPMATVTGTNPSRKNYQSRGQESRRGAYSIEFDKFILGDNFETIVIPPSPTPKDEIAYKRLIMDAVSTGFISHRTGYEEFNILNPEDELSLLEDEQSNPALNPEGVSSLMSQAPNMEGLGGLTPPGGRPEQNPEQVDQEADRAELPQSRQ